MCDVDPRTGLGTIYECQAGQWVSGDPNLFCKQTECGNDTPVGCVTQGTMWACACQTTTGGCTQNDNGCDGMTLKLCVFDELVVATCSNGCSYTSPTDYQCF